MEQYEVHRTLGPGLMESTYLRCLCKELDLRRVEYKKELVVPIVYKGEQLEEHYRLDLMVDDVLVVELKTVPGLLPIHQAQVLIYLKLMNRRLGLLINFHTPILAKWIKRLVNG